MSAKRVPTVAFVTLGCPKNEVDSDVMRALVESSAYRVADDVDDADVVVLNTCSFIQDATEESIAAVLELTGEWAPARSGRRVVVAGCMVSRYGDALAAQLPEVDAFVPVDGEKRLLDVLHRLTGVDARVSGPPARRRAIVGPTAYLKVSDGCHRRCAFCTIPAIRGPYRSMPLADVVAEATGLVGGGAREIVLVGQDVTAWGRDLPGAEDASDLLTAVARVSPDTRIRVMYAQPDGLTDRFIETMASLPNVCRYLDMPLQHASAPVLRAMCRSGSPDLFEALIARLRAAMPGIVLRTTLIAGFPGETQADMRALISFLQRVRLDYVGVFVYSPEEGTPAAQAPGQVPVRTRRRRAQRLRDVSDAIGVELAAARVGEVLDVLVEGYDSDEEAVVGRWCGQAPEIDGVVLLDRGDPGEIVRARIVDSFGYDLLGEVE